MIAREVCKQWLKLINERKLPWRILVLHWETPESTIQVLKQFDERSCSSMTEVLLAPSAHIYSDSEFKKIGTFLKKSKKALIFLRIT